MAMRPSMPTFSGRPRLLIPVVVGLFLILALLGYAVAFYADLLWFREVGFSRVFTTVLRTKILLFVVFGLLMALILGANLVIAHRLRPPYRPMSIEQQNLERYRVAVEPRLRLLLVAIAGIIGLFAGSTAAGRWQTWLLWRNGQHFGVDDFQFGRDISYFAFTYPFQRFVLGFLFTAVILSLLGATAVHYLFGGIRLQTPGERVTAAARAHLSVLLGLFVLLKAVAYYLDRYGLAFSSRGVTNVTGASYTDVNAVLPAKGILLFVALVCAGAFIANVVVRNFMLPAIAFGLLVLSAVLIGGVYPAVVEQFRVKPNANEREAPYIERNIKATRAAYGIDKVQRSQPANDAATVPVSELRADKGTIPNARLLDPNVLAPTFTQLQQIRNVYAFAEKLDIDRYSIGGQTQDYVVGVRELDTNGLTGNQRNWINRHLVYTHGNGFVAAPANKVLGGGAPEFTTRDLPTTGDIDVAQPRIYYGELLGDYSIVGKADGGRDKEFDRPSDQGGGQDQVNFTYDGKGGVSIGSPVRRLAYALYFRERNLLLSGALNKKSRIMYVRDPRKRVEKVAPFLQVDGDPYPAVVDGRVLWILDGYTTSDGYPYSERETLGDVTTDSLTGTGVAEQPEKQVNYIRNSVKATVDAYDGTVTLYAFDDKDPVLRTWRKAFPGAVKDASEISDDLRAHFRYPEDFFKVQRDLLARYHVDDPQEFFNAQDFWRVPSDPTQSGENAAQPPYYLLAQGPGQAQPTFQITTALTALRRENLSAYVSVSSDPDDYGTIRVLELPGNTAVRGPNQVQNNFKSTDAVRRDLTLFNAGDSRAVFGNLLTLPVAGGLLYVEPLYVEAGGSSSYPLLRKVLVSYGDKVAYENTLAEALDALFGAGAGQAAPQPTGSPSPSPSTSPSPSGSATPAPSTSPSATPSPSVAPPADLAAAVREIQAALEALRVAQQRGDFAGIGAAQERLSKAAAAFERLQTLTPSASPSAR